jgi:hypothetical protein
MAMMEAVLSTNLHHPNIIQVYTYSLTPLMAQPVSTNGSFTSSRFPKPHVPPEPGLDSSQEQEEQGLVGAWAMGQSGQQGEPEGREQEAAAGAVTGWQVQIVQEYADRVSAAALVGAGLLLPGAVYAVVCCL